LRLRTGAITVTITQLARLCGLSRSTLLYYESAGLLKPGRRGSGAYRVYGEREVARLRQLRVYREAGLTLADIRSLLDSPATDAALILERRMVEIEGEIGRLRDHQKQIARLLQTSGRLRRIKMVTKEKWTGIMRAAGFSEGDMHRWHGVFEKTAPAEHQEFLEFLHIPSDEAAAIRDWSRRLTTDS
jgi:DNA-binding transcriptional MerR regulator